MVVVIPIAYSDIDHLEHFTKALCHHGPYPDDSALILPTPEMAQQPAVARHIENITNAFGGRRGDTESGRAVVQVLQHDLTKGWPIGGNMHFEYAIHFMMEYFPTEPFLWMETDCVGIQPYWLLSLKNGYQMAGVPYFGWTEESYEVQTIGGKRQRTLMDGKHMAGNAIYPPAYAVRNGPNGAPNCMWKTQDRVYPFTIACRWEHRPVHHTNMICHKPRTKNWHIGDDGQIHCEDIETKDPLDVKREGVVDLKGVVFVHGCKDSSLVNLMLEGKLDDYVNPKGNKMAAHVVQKPAEPAPAPVQAPAPVPQVPTIAPAPETPEGIVTQWVRETQEIWMRESGHTDQTIFEDQLISALEVARRHFVNTPKEQRDAFPIRGEVEALLRAGNMQLGKMAKTLKKDPSELAQLLTENGYILKGPAKWVSKAA